jgi:hypothetical protein
MRAGILIIGRLPRPSSSQEASDRKTLGIIANSGARRRRRQERAQMKLISAMSRLFFFYNIATMDLQNDCDAGSLAEGSPTVSCL